MLTAHPVLQALDGLPGAIWQTAPLLRQGKSMTHLEAELCVAARDDDDDEGGGSDEGRCGGGGDSSNCSIQMQRPRSGSGGAAQGGGVTFRSVRAFGRRPAPSGGFPVQALP